MNNNTFLIYTTQEGGFFKTITDNGEIIRFSEEEYEALKESGELDITPPWSHKDDPRQIVKPVLIMLARIEENYDFHLGSSREDAVVAK